MNTTPEHTDQKLRDLLRSQAKEKAPEGFDLRVMQGIQAETAGQSYALKDFIKEYFPYIAGVLVLISVLLVNWQSIPWFSGIPADQPADVERNIRLIQSWMQGFSDIFAFFTSSSISVLFILAIALYFAADRLLNHFFQNRKSSTVQLFI